MIDRHPVSYSKLNDFNGIMGTRNRDRCIEIETDSYYIVTIFRK